MDERTLNCVLCTSQPHDAGPGCGCNHAPCIHDYNGALARAAEAKNLAAGHEEACRQAREATMTAIDMLQASQAENDRLREAVREVRRSLLRIEEPERLGTSLGIASALAACDRALAANWEKKDGT